MAERKLPPIHVPTRDGVIIAATGVYQDYESRQSYSGGVVHASVEYAPRPVVCSACVSFVKSHSLVIETKAGTVPWMVCKHECGCRAPKQDGSSSCSYAEPKEVSAK